MKKLIAILSLSLVLGCTPDEKNIVPIDADPEVSVAAATISRQPEKAPSYNCEACQDLGKLPVRDTGRFVDCPDCDLDPPLAAGDSNGNNCNCKDCDCCDCEPKWLNNELRMLDLEERVLRLESKLKAYENSEPAVEPQKKTKGPLTNNAGIPFRWHRDRKLAQIDADAGDGIVLELVTMKGCAPCARLFSEYFETPKFYNTWKEYNLGLYFRAPLPGEAAPTMKICDDSSCYGIMSQYTSGTSDLVDDWIIRTINKAL